MAHTVDQALAWAAAHPTKTVGEPDDSWAGWCAALVGWASGTGVFFATALDAGDYVEARYGLNPDWRAAPRGARHYWAGVWIDGVECGHVADDLGNDHTLLMASSRVSNLGTAIGTIRFADYGLPNYRGWSPYWGDTTFADYGTRPAGLDARPITDPEQQEEDDMKPFLIWKRNPNGTRQWALVSGDLARLVPVWKQATANSLAERYGAAVEVVPAEWDGFTAAAEVTVELTGQLDLELLEAAPAPEDPPAAAA